MICKILRLIEITLLIAMCYGFYIVGVKTERQTHALRYNDTLQACMNY